MEALYDGIGKGYSIGRKEDPRIASTLFQFLSGAESILNIGAGTGSYEPRRANVYAVDPSREMIKQRPLGAAPVMQAYAESLPFEDDVFSHSMTFLSIHHWEDRYAAFEEIKRVTTTRFIAVTWNPDAPPFWLTEKYFPEIYAMDTSIFPSLSEFTRHFSAVEFWPLVIPADCIDGFTGAYWARPWAYLNPLVRSTMSTFSKILDVEPGLNKLSSDLDSGLWHQTYGQLRGNYSLDVGYTIVVCDI